MKKRVIGSLLAVVISATLLCAGVARVAAEPDEAALPEEETVSESMENAESGDETAEAADGEAPEETESEAEENTEAEDSEEETEEKTKEEPVIQGMKVTLENTLEEIIVSVQVKSFSSDLYSENLLSEENSLKTGETQMIGIPEAFQDTELGMYDVRITTEDGTVTDIPLVPLLEEITGTLYAEDGNILIRIRDARLEAEAEQISEDEMMQREKVASRIMAEALAEEVE